MPRLINMTPLRAELQDPADIPRALLFDISAVLDELHVFDMADGGAVTAVIDGSDLTT